jgi:hypothetical protein
MVYFSFEKMGKRNQLFIAIICLIFVLWVNLGAIPTTEHPHENHHHLNEIGISAGIVWMQPEAETAPGFHLHYMRRIGEEGFARHIGVGLGIEVIFSDHHHYNIMGTLGIFPWKQLVITLSPGLLIVKEEQEILREFSFHVEMMWEFEVKSWVIGPALGFSIAGEDSHFTMGIHIGKGF